MNLVMVPMWIFSGIFFSTERFPAAMQPFIQALPLTALNDALRGVMLEGVGVSGAVAAVGAARVVGRTQLRRGAEDLQVAIAHPGGLRRGYGAVVEHSSGVNGWRVRAV